MHNFRILQFIKAQQSIGTICDFFVKNFISLDGKNKYMAFVTEHKIYVQWLPPIIGKYFFVTNKLNLPEKIGRSQ